MKKKCLLGSGVIVVAVVALGLPVIGGHYVQKNIKPTMANISAQLSDKDKAVIQVVSVKRHWFKTDVLVKVVQLKGIAFSKIIKPVLLKINNYPLSYVNHKLAFANTVNGQLNSLDDKYHAQFKLGLASSGVSAAVLKVAPLTVIPDKNSSVSLKGALLKYVGSHDRSGDFTLRLSGVNLKDETGVTLNAKQIQAGALIYGLGHMDQSKVEATLDINGLTLNGLNSQSKAKATLNALNYQFIFTGKQLEAVKDAQLKLFSMNMMKAMIPKDKVTPQLLSSLHKAKTDAVFKTFKLFSADHAALTLNGISFNSKDVDARLSHLTVSFPGLPANPKPFDYVKHLFYSYDGTISKVDLGSDGKLDHITFNGMHNKAYHGQMLVRLKKASNSMFTLSDAMYKVLLKENNQLVDGDLNLAFKSLVSPLMKVNHFNLSLGVENANKKVIDQLDNDQINDIVSLIESGGNISLGDHLQQTNARNLALVKQLVTNKLNVFARASAELPAGLVKAEVSLAFPSIKSLPTSDAQIAQAAQITVNVSVPSKYADLAFVQHENMASQVNADLLAANGSPSVALANVLGQWKAKGLVANQNARFDEVLVLTQHGATINGRSLTPLEFGYFSYNIGAYSLAKQVLQPLAQQHNGVADYYLALIAKAEKKDQLVAGYLKSAIEYGSAQAKVMQHILIVTAKPLGPVVKH